MRKFICSISFLLIVALNAIAQKQGSSPLAKYSKEWNDPKYLACNTAKNTPYLSEQEKQIIYILNLARINPKLFCKTVVAQAHDICYADTSSEYYYKSLVTTMMEMKPLKLLKPDTLCYNSAKSHALASGRSGYVGHVRQTPESRKKQRFSGECCYYGSSVPLNIVLGLLIDQDVASLGHRRICFTDYGRMTPSMQPHKAYGINTVLDFLY